jgi:1-acyl-sn-glycerol-3-phosphate acyltransferase
MQLEISVVALILLGWSFQMEGPRLNTTVKVVDLLINILVCVIAGRIIMRGGAWAIGAGFFLYRGVNNILPLCKMMVANCTRESSIETVQNVCCEARKDYSIHWERRETEPCIYVANHALWCLDDIVALGALSRKRLSVVINAGPSGLTGIPRDCREYMCVIQRKTGERGEGFRAMKNIMEEEILRRGKSLILFPEDMKKKTSPKIPAPVRSGTLQLARDLNIPIVPLWIHWPCQFPTLLNSCSKDLIVREGGRITPGQTQDIQQLKERIIRTWTFLSNI